MMESIESSSSPSLFLKFTVLSCSNAFSPLILKWILQFLNKHTLEETALFLKYKNIKKQLTEISMVDEFAKYAKLERQAIKIKGELNQAANARMAQSIKMKLTLTYCTQIILGIVMISMIWIYRYEPLFYVPSEWLHPLDTYLNWPTGKSGVVSVSAWLLISGTSLKTLIRPYY